MQAWSGEEAPVHCGFEITVVGSYGILYSNQMGACSKSSLDLQLCKRGGDARVHMAAAKDALTYFHKIGDRMILVVDNLFGSYRQVDK